MDEVSHSGKSPDLFLAAAVVLGSILISLAIIFASSNLSGQFEKFASSGAGNVAAGAIVQNGNAQAGANAGNAGAGNANANAAPQGDWSWADSAPSIGPKDAKVTVIEFADYQCPYCGMVFGKSVIQGQDITSRYGAILGTATKIANEYAKAGKIRFVYKPMAFLGQESIDAANAAYCAREIGGDEAYFKMHDALFTAQNGENEGAFSKDNLKKIASSAGFDSAQMSSCIDGGKYLSQVAKDSSDANSVGVSGTPTFALNNKVLPGGAQYTTLKAAVDAALAAS